MKIVTFLTSRLILPKQDNVWGGVALLNECSKSRALFDELNNSHFFRRVYGGGVGLLIKD